MNVFWIVIICMAALIFLVLAVSFICFYMAFYAKRDKYPKPVTPAQGEPYKPFQEMMKNWIAATAALPCEQFSIHSFDGLTLYGKYYEYAPGAPIELMMHGYRSVAERDLCGGVQRCFSLGHSAFIVDQRACGKSDGHVISFGINESRDCQSWVEFLTERFGENTKIMLTGISMGASSVLMATDLPLPKNVVGVLADCGYTSAKEIIMKVVRDMKLPSHFLYPFIRLGARLYGGFDPDKTSALEAMSRCRLPVLFIHGEKDGFVPCEMSRKNFEACTAEKRLLTMPEADHGLCYVIDAKAYVSTLREFCDVCGIPVQTVLK